MKTTDSRNLGEIVAVPSLEEGLRISLGDFSFEILSVTRLAGPGAFKVFGYNYIAELEEE
jgi:hypothetical protein